MNSRHLDRVQAAGRRSAAAGHMVLPDLHATTELHDAVAEALIGGEPLMTVAALADLSPLAALDALDARDALGSTALPAVSLQAPPGA
ncbi:hypothetical protein [Arthrobacter sp. TMS1-12-1]